VRCQESPIKDFNDKNHVLSLSAAQRSTPRRMLRLCLSIPMSFRHTRESRVNG